MSNLVTEQWVGRTHWPYRQTIASFDTADDTLAVLNFIRNGSEVFVFIWRGLYASEHDNRMAEERQGSPFVSAFIDMSLSTKVHIQGTMYPSLKSLPLQNICNLLSSRFMVLPTFLTWINQIVNIAANNPRRPISETRWIKESVFISFTNSSSKPIRSFDVSINLADCNWLHSTGPWISSFTFVRWR